MGNIKIKKITHIINIRPSYLLINLIVFNNDNFSFHVVIYYKLWFYSLVNIDKIIPNIHTAKDKPKQ